MSAFIFRCRADDLCSLQLATKTDTFVSVCIWSLIWQCWDAVNYFSPLSICQSAALSACLIYSSFCLLQNGQYFSYTFLFLISPIAEALIPTPTPPFQHPTPHPREGPSSHPGAVGPLRCLQSTLRAAEHPYGCY